MSTENVLNEEKGNGVLADVSGSFYSLIDRLQKHSEWKYPERKWNNDFYYECAFQWKGKEKELEERVLKLENDMRLAGAL
jgi:hypothetical protein